MKRLLGICVASASIAFSAVLVTGCNDLTIETVGIRFFLNEDLSGSFVVTYYGIESTASTPEGQSSDFQDLIEIWG